MIQSMTGFGKSVFELPNRKIITEIKSLNSKTADINIRIPVLLREKELEIRKQISTTLERGKIDFNITFENTGEKTSAVINPQIVKAYMKQLNEIFPDNSVEILKIAMRMPDILTTTSEEISEEEFSVVLNSIEKAIENLKEFRIQEGKVLEKDFLLRLEKISTYLSEIEEIDTERLNGIRQRLQKSVEEIREKVDENRFEQELIFYLEKLDITEEKIRLKNHLNYFEETLRSSESNGRKLGFIAQEIGREINTMGSKANYAPMQQRVVQMKDELEKIKEQVLNIL